MRPEEARQIARLRAYMLGVDVYSHNFLTSAAHRQDRLRPIEPPDFNTLDMVLRSNLRDTERRVLFPDKFDLGSDIDLSPEDCTQEVAKNLVARSEGLTPVLEGIFKLTRQDPDVYRSDDRVKLYRVAKLLGRFLGKSPHLFSMLEKPGENERGSLELTNPYPIGHEGDQRWIVADLRSLLAAEIPLERLAEIDRAFRLPRFVLEQFEMDLQATLKNNLSSVEEAVARYEIVIADWIKPIPPIQRKRLPLDEQLYIHLLTLDFIHYVKVEQELATQRIHHAMVCDVSADLRECNLISRRDLAQPAKLLFLRPILQKVVGEVSDKVFWAMTRNLPLLLSHYFVKPQDQLPQMLNPSLVLAALVFDLDTRTNTQQFHPSMHAQGSTSGSIKMALRKEDAGKSEEYRRIFRHALDWIHYSLRGQQRLYRAQRKLVLGLIEQAALLMESHDTEIMINLLSNLQHYASGTAHVVARAKQERSA